MARLRSARAARACLQSFPEGSDVWEGHRPRAGYAGTAVLAPCSLSGAPQPQTHTSCHQIVGSTGCALGIGPAMEQPWYMALQLLRAVPVACQGEAAPCSVKELCVATAVPKVQAIMCHAEVFSVSLLA